MYFRAIVSFTCTVLIKHSIFVVMLTWWTGQYYIESESFCKSNSIKTFLTVYISFFFLKIYSCQHPVGERYGNIFIYSTFANIPVSVLKVRLVFISQVKLYFSRLCSFLESCVQSAVVCICNSKMWHFTPNHFTVRFKMKMIIFKLYFHKNSSNTYIFDLIINRSVFSSWFECKWLTVSVTSHLCLSAHCDL